MESRRYIALIRKREYTDIVYGGQNYTGNLNSSINKYYPEKTKYNVYFGEMHGHTNLSDATPDIDDYFKTARDEAGLDFCAISDHDHGGVGGNELWEEKWDIIQKKVQQYHEDNKFITLLAYERDSHPWYDNMVLYYKGAKGEMVRGEVDGEINKEELCALLKRDDIIAVPHTTSYLHSGCDFKSICIELMTPLVEVYSRWGTSEYFGNPNPCRIETDGGFWRDALEKGARMGCIGGSDDHHGYPGLFIPFETEHPNLRYRNPGLTAVIAKELSRQAIFDALKARRCYALSGARIYIDFRINDSLMGSEIKADCSTERRVYFFVRGETALKTLTVIKNGRDYMVFHINDESSDYEELFFDYPTDRKTDYYYLRVEQMDGRMAWTSPIWVDREKLKTKKN